MVESRSDLLRVPGATLYYKVQGRGPLLFVLQGGDGDADATDALAKHLVETFTVLTYDRRGLSRSRRDDAGAAVELTTHGEDASQLLEAVTDEPALVFGASLGAMLGLDLVSHHAEQVRLLVAHEPPVTELLPAADREAFVRGQEEAEDLHRREGTGAAMRRFIALTGLDYKDRERDRTLAPPNPRRAADLEFFFTHDAPAARRYRLDLPALHAQAERVVPAAGASGRDGPSYRCAQALAEELARPLQEFPGGHAGYVLRPRGFAARLAEVLAGASSRGKGRERSPGRGPRTIPVWLISGRGRGSLGSCRVGPCPSGCARVLLGGAVGRGDRLFERGLRGRKDRPGVAGGDANRGLPGPFVARGRLPSKMHLELAVGDRAEALALGAARSATEPATDSHLVLLDPAGNPYCLSTRIAELDPHSPRPATRSRQGECAHERSRSSGPGVALAASTRRPRPHRLPGRGLRVRGGGRLRRGRSRRARGNWPGLSGAASCWAAPVRATATRGRCSRAPSVPTW